MKQIIFSVYLLLLGPVAFADTIDVLQPYHSDSIVIANPLGTLNFSNGVAVQFKRFSGGTLEDSYVVTSVVVDNYQKAGFKYLPDANYVNVKSMSGFMVNIPNDSMKFYSNNDTCWKESICFPDSLVILDHIFDGYDYDDSLAYFRGKWIMRRDANMSTVNPITESSLDGFNIIIYVKTTYNNMKLQICNMNFLEEVVTPGYEITLESMTIKWASDSLGNGRFVNPTKIRPVITHKSSEYDHNVSGPRVFNLIGQMTGKQRKHKLPFGLYIRNYNDNVISKSEIVIPATK